MARAKTTRPETIRAKSKKRSVTQRLTALEVRVDSLELAVVQRLDRFEQVVIANLARFGSAEERGRNIFRAVSVGIGLAIFVILAARIFRYI